MPPHRAEVPYEKRVAVVALRLLLGLPFGKVAEKLDLEHGTAQNIYSRALERTEPGLRDSFLDVARNARNAPRTGRPRLADASPRSRKKREVQHKRQSRPQVSQAPAQQGVDSSHIEPSINAPQPIPAPAGVKHSINTLQPILAPGPSFSNASWNRSCNGSSASTLSIIPYAPPVPKPKPNGLVG